MDAPNATTSGRVTAVLVDAPETAPARKATMKAIVQDRYGPPDALELREIDQPTVKDNQVVELPAPMPPRWSPSAGCWSRSMTGRSYSGPACCRG